MTESLKVKECAIERLDRATCCACVGIIRGSHNKGYTLCVILFPQLLGHSDHSQGASFAKCHRRSSGLAGPAAAASGLAADPWNWAAWQMLRRFERLSFGGGRLSATVWIG